MTCYCVIQNNTYDTLWVIIDDDNEGRQTSAINRFSCDAVEMGGKAYVY